VNATHAIPVVGFAAWSGTGKTTLLRQLIPWFSARGLRVGLIKSSHHDFEIDVPGKDSYELRRAGASQVLLASPRRTALILEEQRESPPQLSALLARLDTDRLDLVLVEGLRDVAFPKVELHRPALGKPLFYPGDPHIIAFATDRPLAQPVPIPVLDLNDPAAIGDFVLKHLNIAPRAQPV
jgi:molybdopterin-guanine dinucleotide biosynthesis protein MobB